MLSFTSPFTHPSTRCAEVDMCAALHRERIPTAEEMMTYQSAWRRRLLAHALAARNSGRTLDLEQPEGCMDTMFQGSAVAGGSEWAAQMALDEHFIQQFETTYWPTVILPIRQLVLQDLKRETRSRHPFGVTHCEQRFPMATGMTVVSDNSSEEDSNSTDESGNADALEFNIFSSKRQAQVDTVQGLMEEVAEEVSAASEAELLMAKCIQQMQPQRFSKSVQFAVQLDNLEVTLAAAYEAPACIRVTLDELYTHIAMYYDLRMSVVAAFEGVQVIDNLMPELSHRRIIASSSHTKLSSEGPTDPCKGRHKGNYADIYLSPCSHARCLSRQSLDNPPVSPLQPGSSACILDWSANCTWRGGCPFEPLKKTANAYRDNERGNNDAAAGGWLRFDKVYVPLDGIPDMRLYVQTHGSLLCTITPAAVAFVVQSLQEPVHLVEGSSILEAASKEVQDALHRNELFLARLLVGEVDHPTVDICVDIPVPQKLLLPFSHKDVQCRGLLFHSGAVSVDSSLQLWHNQPPGTSPAAVRKAYDRYTMAVTGACARRVINCQQVEWGLSACPLSFCSLSLERKAEVARSSSAVVRADAAESGLQGAESSSRSRRRRCDSPEVRSAVKSRRGMVLEGRKYEVEEAAETPIKPANEDADTLRCSICLEKRTNEFILWPTGMTANFDVCNRIHSQTGLPAFRITLQDQGFR